MVTEQEAASLGFEPSRVPGLDWHHSALRCVGETCPIHAPSDHPLATAALLWRGDRGFMERVCKHGVGHPDPDDLAYKKKMAPDLYEMCGFEVHGCDGCCTGEDKHG